MKENMNEMINKSKALALLQEGRAIYGLCSKVEQDKNRAFFTCGIPGLNLMQPCAAYEEGKGYWFEITGRTSDRLYMKPVEKAAQILPGMLCLGNVASVEGETVKVWVHPRFFVKVVNPKEVWGNKYPAVGTPCAVMTEKNEGGITVGRLVMTESTAPLRAKLPDSIQDCFSCPKERLAQIAALGGLEKDPGTLKQIRMLIAEAYEAAVAEDAIITEDTQDAQYTFEFQAFRAVTKENAPIFIGIREDRINTGCWHVEFAGLKAKGLHKILYRDAVVPDMGKLLCELAGLALPEDWSYPSVPENPYYVLESYLHYTYYNATFRDGIRFSRDGQMKLFNTGLVNYHYQPIYGVFERTTSGKKRWILSGFCVCGERELGKRVSFHMPNRDLPPRINLLKDLNDLLLDGEGEVNPDVSHILRDNVDRLPLEMLIREAGEQRVQVLPIIDKMRSRNDKVRAAGIAEMKRFIDCNQTTYLYRLAERLRKAIDVAVLRARWNYKTAVPVYYAARNSINLLLPLCLNDIGSADEHHADVALVISKQPSGNYQAETILTLDMAYLDSRLICRPDSDWLTQYDVHKKMSVIA